MSESIESLLEKYYAPRLPWAKKGDAGKVLIISGSAEYSGSPIFNAMSALRAGADLVMVVGHLRAMNIVATYAPDILTVPLSGELSPLDVSMILDRSSHGRAVVIGSGLARSEATHEAIRAIVADLRAPAVLDAEAIHAFAGRTDLLRGKNVLLTPNHAEFKTISGILAGDSSGERSTQVLACAKQIGVTVLLKGHVDVISDGEQVRENGTGLAVMAKGGFGDTLAGIAGALLARGASPFDAGRLSAYINGRAGQLASVEHGEGTLASDIFAYIPKVIKEGMPLCT